MDINYLKKLIKMLDESGLSELDIEEEGKKLHLAKPRPKISALYNSTGFPIQSGSDNVPNLNKAIVKEEKKEEELVVSDKIVEIKSPMVGTFYRAPSPEANNYVEIGSNIKEGDIICIIEAMKLMNEIESDISGKIVKILVENGQAVEYDQPLFLIEKK